VETNAVFSDFASIGAIERIPTASLNPALSPWGFCWAAGLKIWSGFQSLSGFFGPIQFCKYNYFLGKSDFLR
jgi:hypothetical protein